VKLTHLFPEKNALLIKHVLLEVKQLEIIKTETLHFIQEVDKLLSVLRKQYSDNLGHNFISS